MSDKYKKLSTDYADTTIATTDPMGVMHSTWDSSWSPLSEYDTANSDENPKDSIDREITSCEDRTKTLRKLKNQLNELKFKVGDIVFHKKHGICIVQKINHTERSRKGDSFLETRLASQNGSFWVPVEDVMVRTKLTETLYE